MLGSLVAKKEGTVTPIVGPEHLRAHEAASSPGV